MKSHCSWWLVGGCGLWKIIDQDMFSPQQLTLMWHVITTYKIPWQIIHGLEANCKITVGRDGSFTITAIYNIPAGSPLIISLGDPTNPTPIFAQYSLLPNDCATIIYKAMHLDPQIKELGYDFKDLLFQTWRRVVGLFPKQIESLTKKAPALRRQHLKAMHQKHLRKREQGESHCNYQDSTSWGKLKEMKNGQ